MLARGHETNLLAVLLLGDAEPEPPRLLANRGLVERADGEPRARQLRLRQREQKVRLVLLAVDASLQPVALGRRIEVDLRVVPRGHGLSLEGGRAVNE